MRPMTNGTPEYTVSIYGSQPWPAGISAPAFVNPLPEPLILTGLMRTIDVPLLAQPRAMFVAQSVTMDSAIAAIHATQAHDTPRNSRRHE